MCPFYYKFHFQILLQYNSIVLVANTAQLASGGIISNDATTF